jgi:hypothetical protein
MAPQFLLCGGGLGTQSSTARAWAVSVRVHNRTPLRRADKGPPLGTYKEGAGLPLTGGDATVQLSPWKCRNSSHPLEAPVPLYIAAGRRIPVFLAYADAGPEIPRWDRLASRSILQPAKAVPLSDKSRV